MERNWAERIAIALDLDDFNSACQIMDKLGDSAKLYKVGPQLFTRVGPDIIKEIKNRGKNVFLDLKFHDIPNTVAKASESAVELGVDIFNIHISGGIEMMTKSASATKLKAIQLDVKKPILLGVTVLTSMDIKELQTIYDTKRDLESQIIHLAKLAKSAGLDGVVASPKEIKLIRSELGNDFVILTPGVRIEKLAGDDQKRVMTPSQAFLDGADYIVIGRPIYQSPDPADTFENILQQIKSDIK